MSTHVKISYPVDALVSYHYFRDDTIMDKATAGGYLRLIGDSGAFSAYSQGATITLGEYAAWCHRWADKLMWRASLDVIGDPALSLANWRALRDTHGLATVPTIHCGTDPSWIGAYATAGCDFIGLGGMVGRSRPVMMRWATAMIRYARRHHPHVRFHAWGQAGRTFLDALPVFSADSSRSAVAYRYGQLHLFDPATGRSFNIKMDGSPAVNAHGRLLRTVYGVDPADVRTSHAGNRRLLIQMAAVHTQLYAAWLQKRHQGVSAPRYGLAGTPTPGPLIHNVSTEVEDYQALAPDPAERTTP